MLYRCTTIPSLHLLLLLCCCCRDRAYLAVSWGVGTRVQPGSLDCFGPPTTPSAVLPVGKLAGLWDTFGVEISERSFRTSSKCAPLLSCFSYATGNGAVQGRVLQRRNVMQGAGGDGLGLPRGDNGGTGIRGGGCRDRGCGARCRGLDLVVGGSVSVCGGGYSGRAPRECSVGVAEVAGVLWECAQRVWRWWGYGRGCRGGFVAVVWAGPGPLQRVAVAGGESDACALVGPGA